ncbi:PilZ domain-containing protein [Pseudalkalibacillus caeni]|uniref:PilZ domain-containing protein n=1 Tax=Exobacillus caeni TaxID=2574798 RepID=A0A5R9EZA3_9BACL|nr:PilZ domain-containing protein [Pseudalkalibacillus caeni]TLS35420.1 PilZ domain-containing protein [Pseudalkalibacillus caeni]
MSADNRQVFRHQLDIPIEGKMRLSSNKAQDEYPYTIMINDVGGEGLGFTEKTDLALNTELDFEFKLNEENLYASGKVVWKKGTNDSFFYGVKFIFQEQKEASLIFQEVNRLVIRLHKRKMEA